jgi:hypothetical protein
MHAMVNAEAQEALGFESFPAERGLYETLLRSTELHRQDASGTWRFMQPGDGFADGFAPLWGATRAFFSDTTARVGVDEIYSLWTAPPF